MAAMDDAEAEFALREVSARARVLGWMLGCMMEDCEAADTASDDDAPALLRHACARLHDGMVAIADVVRAVREISDSALDG